MYPKEMIAPMRAELVEKGFTELFSAEEVEKAMVLGGTVLMFVNSVCGCAARAARPGVLLALQNEKVPEYLFTVFAGVDKEATAKTRDYMVPFPPSSPSIALFKDGELVHVWERHHIEGRPAEVIAETLTEVFDKFC